MITNAEQLYDSVVDMLNSNRIKEHEPVICQTSDGVTYNIMEFVVSVVDGKPTLVIKIKERI